MPGDLERISEMLDGAGIELPADVSRLESAWSEAVGEESARHTQMRALKRGRLTVATSSAVWAQSLQLLSEQIRQRLNAALGGERVREIVFRPAGWDPGGGGGGPRPPSGGAHRAGGAPPRPGAAAGPTRPLTREEDEAVERVRRAACTPELGEAIAGAMRAALVRRGRS